MTDHASIVDSFPGARSFNESLAADRFPSEGYAWYVVGVLLLALTVAFVDRQILTLMVQPVRADLGLTDTQISVLHGLAFVIFYTVLGIPLGRWADHRNRQRMIVGGMVVWCMATAACAFANNFNELFVARIFVGVGEATLSPAAYSMIADYFPREKRARAMSVYSLGIILGTGVALILGGQAVGLTAGLGEVTLPLLGSFRGWQVAFLTVGLPGLVVAALMTTVREPVRKERSGVIVDIANTLAFAKERALTLGMVSAGLGLGGGAIGFGFAAWMPTFFIRVHGWTPPEIAGMMGLIFLTFGVSGAVAAGFIADRVVARGRADGTILVPLAGVIAMIPAAPIVGLASNVWISLAAYAWLNFWLGFPTALGIPTLHSITPNEYRGQVTASYLLLSNLLGFGFGPTLIAIVTQKIFANDQAVGASLALVTTTAGLLGALLLIAARPIYIPYLTGYRDPKLKGELR